jgi:glucose/arabinose dehydrogenase
MSRPLLNQLLAFGLLPAAALAMLGFPGVLPGAVSADPAASASELVDLPSLQALNLRGARVQTVLSGLEEPWAFEFIADNEVLITQRRGKLLRYRLGDDSPREVAGLPQVSSEHQQAGLLDVALHPDFARNQRIYFSFAKSDANAPQYTLTALASGVLDGDRLQDVAVLLEALPYGWSSSNFGGAIAFDAAGFLYLSIGDRADHEVSQRGDRLQGKLVRLKDDGTVPSDNPFVDVEGIDDRIYAIGLRNAQGLHFDAPSGLLFEAEHGPMGGDEVNIIKAGANYGWPKVTYGKNYTGEDIGSGTHAAGMIQPIWYYLPSIAPSPLLVYRGAMFPEWQGDVLVGALRGEHVSRLDLDGERVRSAQPMLGEIRARIRDLKVAKDGALFMLTQSGFLYRLSRDRDLPALTPRRAEPSEVYAAVCAGCHASGAYRAPNPEVAGDWTRILAEPPETSYQRTRQGYGAMPKRGLCHICSDEVLRGVVDWMRQRAAEAE